MSIFKNKNKGITSDDEIEITREVSDKIEATLGTQPVEKGGFMLGNDGVVNEFIFDISADTSSCEYSPDTEVMTIKINNSLPKGKELVGMFHTHPAGFKQPSSADIKYAKRIMEAYSTDYFIIGVGQVRRYGSVDMYFYKVYSDKSNVRVRKIAYRIKDNYNDTVEEAIADIYQRISPDRLSKINLALDTESLGNKTIVALGLGGSLEVFVNMARCGASKYVLFDRDFFQASNISNQYAEISNLGRGKVEVAKGKILEVNPSAIIKAVQRHLDDNISDEEFVVIVGEEVLSCPDNYLIVACTDDFRAQARAAALAVKYGIPFLAAQMYQNGDAGEICFSYPGVTPSCPRCMIESRYRAYKNGFKNNVTSSRSTIMSTEYLNAICGQIALMMLQYGCPNSRYGKMLELVKDRNFVQVKITPFYNVITNGLFEEALDKEFSFFGNTIWIRQEPNSGCPLCGGEGNLLKSKDGIKDTRRNLI